MQMMIVQSRQQQIAASVNLLVTSRQVRSDRSDPPLMDRDILRLLSPRADIAQDQLRFSAAA
jgi:hypothetical protein